MKHGIDFQDAIPADLWQAQHGPLAEFVKKEWSDWKDEIAEKISDFRELESWLKSLKAPKGPELN